MTVGNVSEVAVPEIDVDELAERREQGVVLIDVRNPDEFENFRVPGARLIPLPEVPERIEEIPDGETVYVICQTGSRSAASRRVPEPAGPRHGERARRVAEPGWRRDVRSNPARSEPLVDRRARAS